MSKLKILFVLIVIVGAMVFGYLQLDKSFGVDDQNLNSDVAQENFIESDGISWYQPNNKDFNLVVFRDSVEINYTPENAQSIEEQSFLNDYVFATNGSYFRGSSVDAEHAGLLQLDGEIIFTQVPDSQLTHVVILDSDTGLIDFQKESEINLEAYASINYSLFQTGPLIIKDREVQSDLIFKSPNGDSRALRTVLGVVDDGRRFIMVTRRNYTLAELADQILAFEVFNGANLSVINLDGGASTAMYSQDLDQFNFMKSRRLPIVLGVK